jgi:hypothetical protein
MAVVLLISVRIATKKALESIKFKTDHNGAVESLCTRIFFLFFWMNLFELESYCHFQLVSPLDSPLDRNYDCYCREILWKGLLLCFRAQMHNKIKLRGQIWQCFDHSRATNIALGQYILVFCLFFFF